MFLPTLIKFAESQVNMLSRPGTSAAKLDEQYYDTEKLTKGERQQAMALLAEQTMPEGAIFVVSSGKKSVFDTVPDSDERETEWGTLAGRSRAQRIVEGFLALGGSADVDTVVIPGCGSSPLGAAAFAKSVAEMFKGKGSDTHVAAIVAGQGAFDQWLEAASGGVLMAPMANVLNAFNPLLEMTAKVNPVVAKLYIDELVDAVHEAATLHALLKARLIGGAFAKSFDNLNMIVSHSKGNWAVLVALLAFELELAELERAGTLREPEQRITVVTFGNPVELPDMHPTMKKLFHYHQFVGAADKLAHRCSAKAWALHLSGEKLDPLEPAFDPTAHPDERVIADTEHHLFAKYDPTTGEESKPYHMPVDQILPQIRQH